MNGTNHTSHDLEVLAAYASGYEPDRSAAESLVATCNDCRVIYEEQLQMRSLLSHAETAYLTESEQVQLVTAIAGAIPRSVRRPDNGKAHAKPLSPVWGRMMAAAAALAVVIGVGATIASQDGPGNAATTFAADTAAVPEFAAGGGVGSGERSTVTSAAGAATIYQLEVAGDLDGLKAEAEALGDDTSSGEGTAVADVSCAEETEELTIRAIGESTYQGRAVLLILAEDDGEVSPRAFFTDDCTEIRLPD
jgi:hypothetical protein